MANALILEEHQKHFEAGNPTFAWLAYDLCSRANISVPVWVSDYFAQAAAGMLKLVRRPPDHDVGSALASVLGMKTGRGETGAVTAAKRAYEASELLRVYRMFRLAGLDDRTARRKLLEASRESRPGMVLAGRTITRRLNQHYPGWRELDFEPPNADVEV